MKAEHADSKGPVHAHRPPRGVSPLRLMILLSILVVFGGALLYDRVIAPPRVKAANEKLLSEVLLYNETGLRPGGEKGKPSGAGKTDGMLYSEDIQKILGMTPTKVESTDLYTIEHYCWWGWVPRKNNYITVLYLGDPKRPHYTTHYANEMPEDTVIPGRVKGPDPVDLSSETSTAAVALPAAPPPASTPPELSPNAPAGVGKGKGRPGGKAAEAASP